MLTDVLTFEAYLPISVINDEQVLTLVATILPDLIRLDPGLPDPPRRAVAQELQARGWDIPILVLTGVEHA